MTISQRQRWVGLALLVSILLSGLTLSVGHWLFKPRTVVVLLQNHHELRATGGFLGSLISLSTAFPRPLTWQTYDIYSLAGTSSLNPDSPPGHQEYLSGGKGLQLADANWWPDIPYSSQIIMQFLQESVVGQPDLVIYLNTQAVQRALATLGPVTLPDYGTTLTADSIFTTIFTARGEFFAGSSAKRNVLHHIATQTQLRMQDLTLTEWQKLWQIAWQQRDQGNVALWSPHSLEQRIISWLGLDGSLSLKRLSPSNTLYLYPVETNVGVNKANAGITRHLQLTSLTATTSALTITWKNDNPASASAQPELIRAPGAAGADHTHYANYFRLYTLPDMTVLGLRSDSSSVTNLTESSFTTSSGQQFKEIGFFVPVLAQTSTSITLTIGHQPYFQLKHIYLARQPGLTTATYYINFHRAQTSGTLDQDLIWQPSVQ